MREKKVEVLLWSLAFPGFAQLLLNKPLLGLLFLGLEFFINTQSNLNSVLFLSFNGKPEDAIEAADYQWLLFYPCLYFFAAYEAFKTLDPGTRSFPYFCGNAYFVTVGVMYSPIVKINGYLIGPIFLPILSVIPGMVLGKILHIFIYRSNKSKIFRGE